MNGECVKMSMVKMTVEQCWDLGLWDKYCEWSGCNPYAINEGQIEKDTIIEFDSEFKKEESKEDIEEKIIYGQEYSRKNTVYCIIQKIEFEYKYDDYIKYLVSYRTSGEEDATFELKDLEEIKYILSLDKY
jgi:hypothetical protein